MDPFTTELYKKVRNTAKKIDQASKAEEQLKNKVKITEEQQEKLRNKQSMQQNIDEIISIYKLYKKEG